MANTKQSIRNKALEIGFDVVGFAPATADAKDAEALSRFLAKEYHGDMDWLARHTERRSDPQKLCPMPVRLSFWA